MVECAFCGASLPPGATFCGACGESATGDEPRARPRAAPADAVPPRRLGALLLLAIPASIALFLAWSVAFGTMRFTMGMFIAPTFTLAIAAPVAWGAWRGARWSRPAALVAALAWGAFMVWAAYDNLSIARAGEFADPARARDFWFFVAHVGLAIGIGLAFRRR